MPPAVEIHSHLTEPLVHPGHLVALLKHLEHELRRLGLSALVVEDWCVRMAWITGDSLLGPERFDHPFAVSQLHVLELRGDALRLSREVGPHVTAEVIASHSQATEAALLAEVAMLLWGSVGVASSIFSITHARIAEVERLRMRKLICEIGGNLK